MARFDPLAVGLPSDIEAEKLVISSSIEFDNRLREAVMRVRPEHLTMESHRIVWRRVCECFDSGAEVSNESIRAYFYTGPGAKDLPEITEGGGLSQLTGIGLDVSLDPYIAQILDTYSRRQLIVRFDAALTRLCDRKEPLNEITAEVEEECRSALALAEIKSGFKNFEDMIRECGGIEAFLSRGKGDAISYPWGTLNTMTNGGMRPGQLITIAGQSGKGKTALVLNIMIRASMMGHGVPLMFSLEMDKEEIGGRMLALTSGVDPFRFTRLNEEEREAIRRGRQFLTDGEYLVDDEDAANMAQIFARTKRTLSLRPVSMVIVDTIQLVEGRKGIRETREQELATISRQMKRMAMKLKIPVVDLSQVNDIENGKEPELKNLRESRAIGHNSNLVMFLHFTRIYDMAAGIPTGDLDLILAKNRSGPEGRVRLEFYAPTGSFIEREGANP